MLNEDCYWKRSLWLAFKWTFLILSCCWFKLVQALGKYRVTRYTSVCTKRFVYLKLFQLLYRTCFKFLNLIICPLVVEFSTSNENESLTFSLERERERWNNLYDARNITSKCLERVSSVALFTRSLDEFIITFSSIYFFLLEFFCSCIFNLIFPFDYFLSSKYIASLLIGWTYITLWKWK